MKAVIKKATPIVILCLVTSQLISAQKADTAVKTNQPSAYDSYMQSRRVYNTAGCVFLFPGLAMTTAGVIREINNASSTQSSFPKKGSILAYAGAIILGWSVRSLRDAAVFRKRAQLELKNGKVY